MNITRINVANLREATPTEQTVVQPQQKVAFKGAIGDKFVREISAGNTVTADNILEAIKGTFGPKTSGVKDILESFLSHIETLKGSVETLKATNDDLAKKHADEKNTMKNQFYHDYAERERQLSRQFGKELMEKEASIKEKDELIAELLKKQVKVKPVSEIDFVTPQQTIETLQEISLNQRAAEESLFGYLMEGKEPKEFIEQLERSNIITKAYMDSVKNVPEVQAAFDEFDKSGIRTGGQEYDVALFLLSDTLKDLDAHHIVIPKVAQQVIKNAKALIDPLKDDNYYNSSDVEKVVTDAQKYYQSLNINMKEYIKGEYSTPKELIEKDVIKGKPIYRFKDSAGNTYEILESDIANHNFGTNRQITPDGRIFVNGHFWSNVD